RVAQHLTEYPILRFGQTTRSHIVFRLADAVRRVAVYDPGFDGISENATKQADRSGCGSNSTSHDGLAAELFRFDGHPGLSSHDVLQELVDVSLRKILHAMRADQRDDVPVNAADVDGDSARLL